MATLSLVAVTPYTDVGCERAVTQREARMASNSGNTVLEGWWKGFIACYLRLPADREHHITSKYVKRPKLVSLI